MGINAGGKDADVGQIAVFLGVIEAVAHHKGIGNGVTDIIGVDLLLPAGGLIQQHAYLQGGGIALLEHLGELVQGVAGIQNIPGELIEAAEIDGATKRQVLKSVTIPMVMPSITVCTFLTLTNSFKLFDQNLALTNGEPSKMSEMLALNIFTTFYGRAGYEGVGQAKAVIFFILVAAIALTQNYLTRRKEVQQ